MICTKTVDVDTPNKYVDLSVNSYICTYLITNALYIPIHTYIKVSYRCTY